MHSTTLVPLAALLVTLLLTACARSDATPGTRPTFDLGEPEVVFRYQTDRSPTSTCPT